MVIRRVLPQRWFKRDRRVTVTEDGGLEIHGYSAKDATRIYEAWLRTRDGEAGARRDR